MSNLTPEDRRAAERLEMAGRLDVAEHQLARCREVIRETRAEPWKGAWQAIGRLAVILGLDEEETP